MTQRAQKSSIHTFSPRKLTALTLAIAALAAGGCSKSNDAEKSVTKAGLEFSKISIGDSNASTSIAENAYREAGKAVADHAGTDGSFGEAASVTEALSKLGLATLAGSDASETETVSMHQSRVIRGHLSEWISMSSVAIASTNFDVSDDKAALAELIELRSNDVEQYQKLHDSLQAEIESYQNQIEDLSARSVSERNESARYELQMTSVSATQAAQLAERVREHSLRADGYELEATRLQGIVGQLLPGASEVQLQVEKAQDQIELLEESIEELEQRVRDSKEDSARARALASEAESKLIELVEDLEVYRDNTAAPANEQVISLLRQSLSSSRSANDSARTSGSIAKASAEEQLGRALGRQARGFAEMVSLFESIQEAGVAGDWTTRIERNKEQMDDLYEQSKQSFQNAASALRSARLRGEVGDSIEAAAARLDLLGGVEPEPEYEEESDYDSEYTEDEDYDDYDESESESDLDEDG